MGLKLFIVLLLSTGYGFFGRLGTTYFTNFNMGLLIVYISYWVIFSDRILTINSFYYYRYNNKKMIVANILEQYCTSIFLFITFITLLFLIYSRIYMQIFSFEGVIRFYISNIFNVYILVLLSILTKLQYGNLAAAGIYMSIVAANIFIGWLSKKYTSLCFLIFPFNSTFGINEIFAYIIIFTITCIFYLRYMQKDIKL